MTDIKNDFRAAFQYTVRPKPYIPADSIDKIAALFENPEYCRAFMMDVSGNGDKELALSELMDQLINSKNPHGKTAVKNILLHGSRSGGVHYRYDGNRFNAARYIDVMTPEDRKAVLCKSWMIADLVDADAYHWNDDHAVKWLDAMSKEDRLDALCAEGTIWGLLVNGEKAAELNRPKVQAWFAEMDNEGRRRLLDAQMAALGFIKVFRGEGLETVKTYMPKEKLGDIFTDKGSLFLYLDEETGFEYLRSLLPQQLAEFTKPDQFLWTPKSRHTDAMESRSFYGRDLSARMGHGST